MALVSSSTASSRANSARWAQALSGYPYHRLSAHSPLIALELGLLQPSHSSDKRVRQSPSAPPALLADA